jgi:hypothetical protein
LLWNDDGRSRLVGNDDGRSRLLGNDDGRSRLQGDGSRLMLVNGLPRPSDVSKCLKLIFQKNFVLNVNSLQ